jgi:uncharacterized iron-regulated protein
MGLYSRAMVLHRFFFSSALCALCALGCAATPSPSPAGAPVLPPAPPSDWLTTLDREHPLVGKVWDVKEGAFVAASLVVPRFAAAKVVLLGERHDNPDHHRLQGVVISELVKAGRKPTVVLEMLEVEQQSLVDAYVATPEATPGGFGGAVGWEKTSWPPFREYQPVFEAAFAGKLPIAAGNLSQVDAKALVKQGLSALPPARASSLRLDAAFPEPLEKSLLEELRASHCGHLPEAYLAPMALAQHARDAQMARVLTGAGAKDGAVLIAGAGHARLDRGVPYYLKLEAPETSVVSLAFVEAEPGRTEPAAYVAAHGPFDYLWFTPRATDEDPCASFAPAPK